jgi:hypothetical protein
MLFIVLSGFAIRIYLSLTSYCISGDGAAYINMAREFDAGQWREPLGAVFSPLYPILVAGMHHLVADWELAGELVSALAGTAAIAAVYFLIREVFARSDLALGAAALTAIHPELAAYSASVRTEAGYIFLTTTTVWLLIKAVREEWAPGALFAGLVAGTAYLYRTEAIGVIFLGTLYAPAAAIVWRSGSLRRSAAPSLAFAVAASLLAAPYIAFLHATTGHWTVGRELNAAMMYGLGRMAHDPAAWRRQGFAVGATPLMALVQNPRLYIEKIRTDFVVSFYNLVQAAGPLVMILLAFGCWERGRRICSTAPEAFLALFIIFYFCGFVLSYTGARFMIHLIPYTFGWVIIGLEALTGVIRRAASSLGWRMPLAVPAATAALILLPQTLWPIGYDMRGVRYAGIQIASNNHDSSAVVARDGRVAWYAGAHFVGLPLSPVASLCEWLAMRPEAGYLLADNHDERQFRITPTTGCLEFVKRYPRYGAGYYDLFVVRHEGAAQ